MIRILVCDDHPVVREGLVMMLGTQPDMEVVGEAADGLEAVAMVPQIHPDLILMDLNMPQMDGLAATEQIRECRDLCKKVTILAITAHDTIGMKEAAIEAGCNGYLTKPIDFDKLRTIIDRILVSHQ